MPSRPSAIYAIGIVRLVGRTVAAMLAFVGLWQSRSEHPFHHSSALRVASARVTPMNTLSMAISLLGSQPVEAELIKRDVADPLQIDNAPLGRGVALDVALCG
jgi:hypothetical protein